MVTGQSLSPMPLVRHLREDLKQSLSQCYARDILDQIFWAAKYLHAKPEFTRELARWACSNYFFSGTETEPAE